MSRLFTLALLLSCACLPRAFSQDSVTIPKSRLEELERKEAELEKLKGATPKGQPAIQSSEPAVENPARQKTDQSVPAQTLPQATAPAVQPPVVVQPAAPPISIASLPPLEDDTVVSGSDLAAQYRADTPAADHRYRKHIFKVRGEIVGFEKPLLIRDYVVLLKTADPQTRVACGFYPPDKFKAVFAADSGTTLVGLLPDGSRVLMAKVGETVIVEGRCKGLTGATVKFTDCQLKSRR